MGDEAISDIKGLFQWTRDFPAPLFSSPERLMEVFAPHVDTIAVRKHRELFEVGSCRIEITSVSHKQKTLQTIAAESPDRTSIERILAELGISHLPNIHYGARLIAMRDT
ncbi:MAG: hypothetical protein K8F25_00255 [Fimbriimonadaceae bacterium]|nr:hypothetical protein [Alphaproteobacteria bacterium]